MNLKQMFFAMFLLTLATIFSFYYIVTKGQLKQVEPTPGTAPAGYVSFPLSSFKIYLKDEASPASSIASNTIYGRLYSVSTPDNAIASPLTPYVDQGQNSNGVITFSSGKVMTATSYKLRIWDTASTPVFYPKLITVTIPALPSEITSYSGDDVLLERIGTFADPMQADATGAGGGPLPTGVTSSHATNTIIINATRVTTDTFTIRIPLTLANIQTASKLKNVVIKPMQDTTKPIPVTAFSSATLTYVGGTNFNVVSDILPYISSQQPIQLGDWTDAVAGSYYLQLTLVKAALTTDDSAFYFYIDDQGNWLATDPIAGQSGASAVSIKIVNDIA